MIHPSVVIKGDVKIGKGTTIGPFCCLIGPLEIGENNKISASVHIGGEPEHRAKSGSGRVIIGNSNVFKENVVIHRGTGERETFIGNNCYFMDKVHVSHDCMVLDDVSLAHTTILAGHCKILRGVTTGISTVFHQWSTVGAYSMTGMGAVVTRDIPPFALVTGNPAKFKRLNKHMLTKLELLESYFDLNGLELGFKNPKLELFFKDFDEYSSRKKIQIKIS